MQLSDYQALIPAPNSSQPKFMSWVSTNLQPYVDAQACLDTFATAFDIDTAVGVQLDMIGQILNVSRTVNFQPDGPVSPVLGDDNYRLVLKARILRNQWKGTKQEIYDFWQKHFPNSPALIQDNQDMTMTVLVVGMSNETTGVPFFGLDEEDATVKGFDEGYCDTFVGLTRKLVLEGYFVPKPAGVKTTYLFMNNPVFGFDVENSLIKGLDEGYIAAF